MATMTGDFQYPLTSPSLRNTASLTASSLISTFRTLWRVPPFESALPPDQQAKYLHFPYPLASPGLRNVGFFQTIIGIFVFPYPLAGPSLRNLRSSMRWCLAIASFRTLWRVPPSETEPSLLVMRMLFHFPYPLAGPSLRNPIIGIIWLIQHCFPYPLAGLSLRNGDNNNRATATEIFQYPLAGLSLRNLIWSIGSRPSSRTFRTLWRVPPSGTRQQHARHCY
jgi:hypothetical protein